MPMIKRLPVYVLLCLGVVVAVVPFLITILASLKTTVELVQGVFALPEEPQWDNYRRAWVDGNFGRFFVNSLLVAFGVLIPSIIFSCMAGYAFARYRFRGKSFIFVYLLLGLVIPLQALVIPLFYFMREIGLLDSLWALILPQIALSMSFGTLLMREAFSSVPREIVEASVLDGASSWRILWQIMFPLSRPFVGTLSLMIFIPLTVVFLLFQRQMIEGLTQGAIKG